MSSCPNLGFEDGTFANWSGGVGWCCPINISGTNFQNNRHTITSGTGTDPRTGGAVPVVFPDGGLHSAKLGNDNTGSEAERLSYSLTVDQYNALFVYRYAVVLEDPDHDPSDQPRFEIRMYDQSNTLIPCGQYNVHSTSGLPGFQTIDNGWSDPVHFQNWTSVGMDLTPYTGQTVTIEFATGDCAAGAHYGYAYIDCYCSPMQILTDFCPGAPTSTLSAPEGFVGYLWSTGETTSTIVVEDPLIGEEYTCTLTSFTGCTVTLTTMLTPIAIAGAFTHVGDCMNHVQFDDQSVVISGPPLSGWWWDFGDGTISTDQNPFHAFADPGPHTISMAAYSSLECPDSVFQTITLLPSPIVDFDTAMICRGDAMLFEDLTPIINAVASQVWDLGDGSPPVYGSPVSHIYGTNGTYDVTLYVADINGCSDSLVRQVTVVEGPDLALGPDVDLCDGATAVLDGNDPGATYMWNTGAQTQTISTDTAGMYWVQAMSPGGCTRTDSVIVAFHPFPINVLSDTAMCSDEPLMLDASNAGSTYAWSTGDTTAVIAVIATGVYSVTITTEHDCVSSFAADITLHPELFVDLGADQFLCDGGVAVLDAGAFDNVEYYWSNGDTTQTTTTNTTEELWVMVHDPLCPVYDTVLVTFQPLPVITLLDTVLCVEEVVPLDAGNEGASYLWTTGETTRTIIAGTQSGLYGVVVTLPTGCTDSSAATITFYPSVHVDLGPDTVVCEGEVITLHATAPGVTQQWSTGGQEPTEVVTENATVFVHITNGYCMDDDTISVEFVPYPSPVEQTVYDACFQDPNFELQLVAGEGGSLFQWSTGAISHSIIVHEPGLYGITTTNPPGCSVTDTIEVREFCPPQLFVPNAFTPDGDALNDRFMPVTYKAVIVDFLIFDRWGELIFTSNSENEGWDGTVKGEQSPIGVYPWIIHYRSYINNDGGLGMVETATGHATLVR